MAFPQHVRLVEVGPRDGLQNEPEPIATNTKLELIDRLGAAGLSHIEAASFVSPKWVPQMADHREVMQNLARLDGVTYSALTPNLKGLEAALECGVEEVAVFGAHWVPVDAVGGDRNLRYQVGARQSEAVTGKAA